MWAIKHGSPSRWDSSNSNMKILLILFVVSLLTACAVGQKAGVEYRPEPVPNRMQKEFDAIPAPDGRKLSVAVYSFGDKTGQRKPTAGIASLSMAVTQGAEVFLIKALQDVGHGQWFDVVERINVDALTKERLIIRQMREAYEGANAKPLMPMQFAGIIMEGGIIGYDSGTESGGAAHRFLGIGSQTQYSKDTVTVSLRAISVNTGKVLAAVHVTKIVYSTADSVAVLKFLANGVQAFEAEAGLTINEPGTMAVKATIEAAVVELIKEGERKGIWDYRKPEATKAPPPATAPAPVVTAPPVVTTPEFSWGNEPNGPEFVWKEPAKQKMYFLANTRVYKKKSNLKGPVYGSFVVVKANTPVEVVETEFPDVVAVTTDSGIRGFVKRERLKTK
jgi:curli production assembly/transport component CsgG